MSLQTTIQQNKDWQARKNPNAPNPFEGTAYADMYANNPYKDLYYNPTFWDMIGLSNKAQDANSEYQRMYNEYVAGIYDLQRQDSYNTPSAEAQRLRNAGINPDLAGLSGESNTDSMSAPNAGNNPALTGVSPTTDVLSTFSQILSFATGSMKTIGDLSGVMLGNYEQLGKLAEPHIVNEFASRFSGSQPNNWSDVRDVSSQALPRFQQKRYKKAFDSLLSSSRFSSASKAYDSLSANDKAMYHYIGKMEELTYLMNKHQYKASSKKAIYDEKYFDTLDPKKAAHAENRFNDSKGWLDKWRNDYYKQLHEDFKNGSVLAGLLLIGSGSLWNHAAGAITGTAKRLDSFFGNK